MRAEKRREKKMRQQHSVSHEDWWQSLVGTALIGTDRQSPERPDGESPLYNAVCQLDWQNAEVALLKTAGIVSVYQQAGQQTVQTATEIEEDRPIEPAKPDSKPCCNQRMAAHLKTGLEQYPQAVKELLSLIADVSQRIPPPLLPAVLRYGEKYTNAQPYVEAVLGNRGRWLAAQNPAWHYVRQDGQDVSATSESVSDRDVVRW